MWGYVDRHPLMVRSLPLRVLPTPGEALDSYLEALAVRHDAAWGDLLGAVGLTDGTSGGRAVYSWLRVLPADLAHDVHTSCGLDPATAQSMTLAALIDCKNQTRCTPAFMAPMCLFPPRSRFCPACLSETSGRWQMWWRLRWAFACPRHRCLLADLCPCCGRGQRIGPHPRGLVPAASRCSRSADRCYGHALLRCGADLSATPTRLCRRGSAVTEAQSTILGVYRAGRASFGVYADNPVSAAEFTSDLTDLAARILRSPRLHDAVGLLPADLRDASRQCVAGWATSSSPVAAPGATTADTAVAAMIAMQSLVTGSDIRVADARGLWSMSRRRDLAATAVLSS